MVVADAAAQRTEYNGKGSMLADCLHGLQMLGPGGLPLLLWTLFLTGLAGGLTHCAGMCAPFVLAQAAAVIERTGGEPLFGRLSGAMLLPYQAGRLMGYATIGALAASSAGFFAIAGGARWILALLLVLASAIMLLQAFTGLAAILPRLPHVALRLPQRLEAMIAALLKSPTGYRGTLLGLLLSALPCGLLYGAVAAAASSGSALAGALGMAAFVAGTIPALAGVALLGRLFGRRQRPWLRWTATGLCCLNALMLLGLAVRLVV